MVFGEKIGNIPSWILGKKVYSKIGVFPYLGNDTQKSVPHLGQNNVTFSISLSGKYRKNIEKPCHHSSMTDMQ